MGTVLHTVASAIVGGISRKLGGGKFLNGAVMAAFARLYNHEGHSDADAIGEINGYDEDSETNSWRKSLDGVISEEVATYNQAFGYTAGDDGYIDARTVKAWAMVESGGSKSAFLSDPMQVNNSGDWVEMKSAIAGLQRDMEMTPRVSVRAALRWWNYKGTLWAADGSRSGWRGDFSAFVRYNGNGRIEAGRYSCYPHKFRYAADVQRLSR